MRRRKQPQRYTSSNLPVPDEGQPVYVEIVEEDQAQSPVINQEKSGGPLRFLQRITQNPDFIMQILLIVFVLAGENMRMDRRIDTVTTSVEKVRNMTEVMQTAMHSLKTAAEAPGHIRRLFQ